METIQAKYLTLKAVYEKAFELEKWDTVEAVEDNYIEAELELVKWGLNNAVKARRMTKEDAEIVFKKSNPEQYKRLVELALKW